MFFHQEAMKNLRNGKGQPVTCHVMLTDVCNHKCAFCSVQHRSGDSLPFSVVTAFIDILLNYGLKSVILSGGGNPILYRCKEMGADINDVIASCHVRGLEVGLISNGMPLTAYNMKDDGSVWRDSWKTLSPDSLDRLTWVRISMSGFDHEENEVYVPDVDPTKTTLGFSYVAHDVYNEPADRHHGRVSRQLDLISRPKTIWPDTSFDDRMDELTGKMINYCRKYKPAYLRLLPNCLEPSLIESRCRKLKQMARTINFSVNREVAFVQYKPPAAPKACYLGYVHPVLNCDGYVYPCDSCVLNESADHRFANPWRMCHWSSIADIYEAPVESLIDNPSQQCPGCVFTRSNELLEGVRDGSLPIIAPEQTPEHVNFI